MSNLIAEATKEFLDINEKLKSDKRVIAGIEKACKEEVMGALFRDKFIEGASVEASIYLPIILDSMQMRLASSQIMEELAPTGWKLSSYQSNTYVAYSKEITAEDVISVAKAFGNNLLPDKRPWYKRLFS